MFGKTGKLAWLPAVCLAAAGCVGDLKIVHTPDLWTVDAKAEAKAGPGAKPAGPPANRFAITRVYTSLTPAGAICDQNPSTVSVAPLPTAKDQFILIDLGCLRTVSQVRMLHTGDGGFPQKYRIDVAGDHNYPYSLALVDQGSPGETVGVFRKPTECRFLRITLLCPTDNPWQIAELTVH